MYANGTGVGQDSIEAYSWISLATARSSGDEQKQYASTRDILARTTAAQLAEGSKRARGWTEKQR
jgi:hypothetical protein